MNFSGENISEIFNNDEKYIIKTVKGLSAFEPKEWLTTFGKPLTRNIIEAKILYTSTGLTLPIKRYAVNPDYETIEFAGLEGYGSKRDKSELLKDLLKEVYSELKSCFVTRLDVAIDYKQDNIPRRVLRALSKSGRVPFKYKHTFYYKTKNERKTNARLNIKSYDKKIKDNLDFDLHRLEFVFQSGYFNKTRLEDIETIYPKIIKTINKFAGINTKILSSIG